MWVSLWTEARNSFTCPTAVSLAVVVAESGGSTVHTESDGNAVILAVPFPVGDTMQTAESVGAGMSPGRIRCLVALTSSQELLPSYFMCSIQAPLGSRLRLTIISVLRCRR